MPVNKTQLIRSVLATMTPPYDYDKAMTAVQARLQQLPAADTKGVEIHRYNLHQVAYGMIKEYRNETRVVTSVPVKIPMQKPPTETFTAEEFQAAARLLNKCGNSLHRTQVLIKTVADIVIGGDKQ